MDIAMDLGGSWFRWEIEGRLERVESENFVSKLEEILRRYRPRRIAIAVAGQVLGTKILSAPNLSFAPLDLAFLQRRYGCEIILENDLNCAALAESRYWREPFLAALYVGTGLGSGIVEAGRLWRGFLNRAGEVGHVPYKEAPFRCGCGKNNCIELYASGGAIAKWAQLLGCEADLARSCEQIRQAFIEALCSAAATLLCIANPKRLVLGGGVIVHNGWVVERIREEIVRYAPPFSLERVEISLSRLKDAPLEGAKILLEGKKE